MALTERSRVRIWQIPPFRLGNHSILDQSGLESLAMRRPGSHLGVEAMSLYSYLARIEGYPAFVARTDKNEAGTERHPRSIIEVVADVNLREELGLEDGDTVEVR